MTTTFSLKQGETRTSSEPISHPLRGYSTSNPKISMFCALYQNYQRLFLKKIIYESYNKLSKELTGKNVIEFLVGQALFTLWIKIVKMLFGSITQEPFGLPKFSLDNLP